MGVIKKSSFSESATDSIEHVLEDIENDVVDQEPEVIRPRKVKQRTPQKPRLMGDINTSVGGKSGKKKKRVENSNFLLSLADPEEVIEISIQDFIPQGISVFTELLIHRNSIEILNEFINCTMDNEEWFQKNALQSGSSNAKEEKYDKRNDHPAFTAVECFRKIDFDLRTMLKKKHVPLGTLIYLEQELVTFFVNRPNSIFHCLIPNSFERLLIHAISQYLDLSSLSYNRSGSRWTRVKNKRDIFSLPSVLLSAYMEHRYNNTVH